MVIDGENPMQRMVIDGENPMQWNTTNAGKKVVSVECAWLLCQVIDCVFAVLVVQYGWCSIWWFLIILQFQPLLVDPL
jgi:hypothetical protein